MSLKDAFAGIRPGAQEPEAVGAQEPASSGAQEPKSLRASAPKRGAAAVTGKSSHPEFEAVKIYVRKQTRKAAWRKWEDAQGGDFSDLVQQLLHAYLSA